MLDELQKDIDDAANSFAGNWLKFQSFGWDYYSAPDSRCWGIVYTMSRDSGPLEESNHLAVVDSLNEVDPDERYWRTESHSHWAVGHCTAIVVRPRDDAGEITPAFRELHRCAMALADYPVLNESDFSDREYQIVSDDVFRYLSRRGLSVHADAVLSALFDEGSGYHYDGDHPYFPDGMIDSVIDALGIESEEEAEVAS